MNFLNNIKEDIKTKPLKYQILAILIILFIGLLFTKPIIIDNKNSLKNQDTENELMVFIQDGCLHCLHAEQFLNSNKNKFKNIHITYYNLKDSSSQVKLFRNISRLRIPQQGLGTPIFVINDNYIIGFGEQQKSNLVQLLNEKKIK